MAFGLPGFSLDPAALIGSAISGVIGAPVIIGLSSSQAPIPNFVIGIIPKEEAKTSITLPAFQLAAGDLFMKSAVNGGRYTFDFIVSQDSTLNAAWLGIVSTALQGISAVGNSIANFGGVTPNLSGVTSNYAVSQITTLHNMKNNTQPILLLNSFITLGSISQKNPYLSSNWFIEDISATREEAEGGAVVSVTLKELLTKRSVSATSLVTNFANEILGPGAGSSLANLL